MERYVAHMAWLEQEIRNRGMPDEHPFSWPDDEVSCPVCRGECEIQYVNGIMYHQCIVCNYEW